MPSITNPAADQGKTSAAFKRRFKWRLLAVLTGGMFLDGYILGIIGPVTGTMSADLGLSTLWEGMIAAGALIGILVGSPLGGWAGDKFGRKPLFLADMGVFLAASALQFFVDSAWQLFVVRLLMGVAIGVEYSVGWPLLSEFAPARLRGRLMGVTLIAWYVGFMVAFLIGHVLNESTNLSWEVILGTSTLIAGVLFVGRIGLPESPRWLWSQGRKDEALDVAHRYMENVDDMADLEHEDVRKGTFGSLFTQHRRATLFISVFWFCAVTPYFAIATFADSVLDKYGLSGGLTGGVALSGLAVASVVLTVLLIDKVGRRVLTVPPQWLCAGVLAAIGLWVGAPPLIVLVLFLAFSFLSAMCGTLTSIYPSEVFPTEVRGIGTGFAASVSRVGAALGTFLLPWSMSNLGTTVTLLVAAGIAAVGAAVSQWLAPETRGKSLTETAAEFTH